MEDLMMHEAIIFATRKHSGQVRKGTDIPYITHPVEVMAILAENDCATDVLVAGLLHDTLEDTDTSPEEIISRFGPYILELVMMESEDKTKSWKERKQKTIEHLAVLSDDAKLICCADKLANLRSMYADLNEVGQDLWSRFNAPKASLAWYYHGILEALRPSIPTRKMFRELDALVPVVFK